MIMSITWNSQQKPGTESTVRQHQDLHSTSVDGQHQNPNSHLHNQHSLNNSLPPPSLSLERKDLEFLPQHKYTLPSIADIKGNHDASKHSLPSMQTALNHVSPASKGSNNNSSGNGFSIGTTSIHGETASTTPPLQHDPSYRPLNVKDALSYLEQVKFQFNNKPDIYNRFLDIMKDFKSQTIDTPGVIGRVSTLFKGYPALIQGFNTFLPQGYKIECSSNPRDPIKVTTPFGTTGDVLTSLNPHSDSSSALPNGRSVDISVNAQQRDNLPFQQDTMTSVIKQTGDIEFSHAITYVNKIKTRFADQPDIYKQFLEILQTYQREQKPINEVYAQVTILFKKAPDLLDDFKKFLPDSSGPSQHQLPSSTSVQYYSSHSQQQNLPPLGSFSPPNQSSVTDQPTLLPIQPSVINIGGQPIITAGITNQDIPISNFRNTAEDNPQYIPVDYQPFNNTLSQQSQQGHTDYIESNSRPEIDLDPSLVPMIPEPIKPSDEAFNLIEETTFFDKAKKFIGNKQIYTEFLKILNLYSQDLLEKDELVDKVEFYIGNSKELFDWFKSFVGYNSKPKLIENVVHEKHRLDLDLCEACGPSYKRLPKTDTFMPCSGRDEMCWEVLNDEWVGHPVWASEDSGFIAHRKNQYEETLFKTEEERHEYDFYIEANLRTIQTLETIANKISNMTSEEKATFKLPPGLSHTSVTIYRKVIRKIYDKDRGFEIINALHENPTVAVPIVLKRLKQKDEEWRRAQREWNKVWRELEQKVFFKSLDHLGLTFKQADKKLLTTKQLVSEISCIKMDQINKRIHPLTPKPKSQLDFDLKDYDVIYDILYLIKVHLNHSGTYSNPDKDKLFDFFKGFFSLFFSLSMESVENNLTKRMSIFDQVDNDLPIEASYSGIGCKRIYKDDQLLRDTLRRHKHQKNKHLQPEDDSNGSSEKDEESEEMTIIREESRKQWLLGNAIDEANENGQMKNRKIFNLFSNTNIYAFFRHVTTIYERLFEVKEMDDEITNDITSRKTVQFASDLNLISTQLTDMGLDFKDSRAYEQLLRLSKKLIEGNLEHQWFEESLRQAYKNKAFKIYTIDKVIQALVKHAHTIVTDVKTSEIMSLFEKDRKLFDTSTKDQILYRINVRSYMNPTDNMFRIEYNSETMHVRIQFVALEDTTLEEPKSLRDKWNYYLTSYSISQPTEGVSHRDLKIPFLETMIEKDFISTDNGTDSVEGISKSNLGVSIHPKTYMLTVESGSQDVFTRKSVNSLVTAKCSRNSDKDKNLKHFLNGDKGWRKNLFEEKITDTEGKINYVKSHGNLENHTGEVMGTDSSEGEKVILNQNSSFNQENSKIIDVNIMENKDTKRDEVDPET